MKFLFYRYNSICEPDMIEGFALLGHEADTIDLEMTEKMPATEKIVAAFQHKFNSSRYDGVVTVNYYPVISEICRIYRIPYLAWTVDCPVLELLSDTVSNQTNRLFCFDYQQYQEIYPYNPNCVFYLPLATNTVRWDRVISQHKVKSGSAGSRVCNGISDIEAKNSPCQVRESIIEDIEKAGKSDKGFEIKNWQSDISFVGSLYTEKCPYDSLTNPPVYLKGYLEAVMNAQKNLYGAFLLEDALTEEVIREFVNHTPDFYTAPERSRQDNRWIMASKYLGMKVTSMERLEIMNFLGSRFSVDLYTGSNTKGLPVNNKGFVKTLTEMPLVFHYSKINLNLTCKSIRTGVPQRVWDIMGAGGFVLTNYQPELEQYFKIGEEIEVFGSLEELEDKCRYYLEHEEERKQIAERGYQLVKKKHNYRNRIQEMIMLAFGIAE